MNKEEINFIKCNLDEVLEYLEWPGGRMYNKVVIAGVGSLGSFFSYHLAKSGCIKEMLLYDSDIVDEKNLKNSIFTKEDIGKPKVYSIKQ